jgi:ATP-binding cassette, subfamily B, multidrug efflux pump
MNGNVSKTLCRTLVEDNVSIHEEEVLGKAFDSRLIKRLFTYIWPFRGWMFLSLIILLIRTAAELAEPLIIKIAIDENIAQGDFHGLTITSIYYMCALVVQALSLFGFYYLSSWLGQKMMFTIRMQVFSHIQKLPLSYFDKNPVGRMVTRTTNDIEALNDMLSSGAVAILGDIVVLIGIVFVLVQMNLTLALITFAVLPLMLLATDIFRRNIRQAYRNMRLRLARINSYLQENITGMATVQIFNREKENLDQFIELNSSYRQASLQTVRYHAIFFPVISLLTSVSTSLIIWYGGGKVIQGALSLGVLVAFMQYAKRFFHPLQDLADKYNNLQAAMASSERIFKILDEPEQKSYFDQNEHLTKRIGHIHFEDVSFAYNDDGFVLKNISFRIEQGEKIAIVGATGAGKTSIISLINRMYEPTRGRILLDDIDITHVDLKELRSRIGIVLQDVFIFSGTVGNNISLGNENISKAAIEAAAERVNAHKFISNFTDGFDHILAERGGNLSVGQKQLLSFARVLAYDPEILILDEATSSVDTETEVLISTAIHELMQNRTSIIIAHRLSTIKDVDRIIVLHKGKVREIGGHDELLAQKGVYHRLYQLQFGGEAA